MSILQISPKELSDLMEKMLATPEMAAELWAWVSQKHYEVVVAQAGKSREIVMLNERFDWLEVEKQGQAYRRYAGKRGVPETHTVRQLCRGLVLKHYYGWSYLTTAQKVRQESLYRWFARYNLNGRTFCAVTLERFEVWLKEHHPHLSFIVSQQQIDEDFPEEKKAAQIGDTFAMRSRAREESRTQLLRTLALRILTQLEMNSPELRQTVEGMLSRDELFGAPTERPEWRQSKNERDKMEERTACATHQLLRAVRRVLASTTRKQDVLMLALERWIGYLEKVLRDEFLVTLSEEGGCTQAALRTKHEKGAYVIGSAIDPEATFRLHGDRCDLGYNIGLSATTRFIRGLHGLTGATPNSKLVVPPLAEQWKELGVVPPKLIYDRAAGSPKTFAEVSDATDGKTQLVARLIDHTKAKETFGPQDSQCTPHHWLRRRQRRLPGAHGFDGAQSQNLGYAHQGKEEDQTSQAARRLRIIVVRPLLALHILNYWGRNALTTHPAASISGATARFPSFSPMTAYFSTIFPFPEGRSLKKTGRRPATCPHP